METFAKALGYIAITIISFFLGGCAVQQLWQWFVVPVFHLPVMTFLQGVGLCMTVRYFTFQYVVAVEPEDASTKRIAFSVLSPLAALLGGWIIHSCM